MHLQFSEQKRREAEVDNQCRDIFDSHNDWIRGSSRIPADPVDNPRDQISDHRSDDTRRHHRNEHYSPDGRISQPENCSNRGDSTDDQSDQCANDSLFNDVPPDVLLLDLTEGHTTDEDRQGLCPDVPPMSMITGMKNANATTASKEASY